MNPSIAQLVFTDGRGEMLADTLASFDAKCPFPYCQRVLIDDSANALYATTLDELYGDRFQIVHHPMRRGFAGAIQDGFDHLRECEAFLWLEDDFTLNESLDLHALWRILEWNPKLAQVALLRQPWNEQERRAGGIVELHPEDYIQQERDGLAWLEHTRNFTTNPSLTRYAIAQMGWLQAPESEGHMGFRMRDAGYKFAYYGRKFDAPRVTHIGEGRATGAKGY